MTSYDIRTGALLVNISSNDTLTYNMQGTSFQMKNGMMALDAQQGHWNAWNSRTGALVWTSSPASITSQDPWGNWWAYYTSSYDINETCSEIIACAYNGLWAFNWADGKVLWHYFDNNTVPFETPYGGNSFFTGNVMADDKVYAYAGEHTPSEPINRGWDTICLNATTGELIWHIENTMVPGAIADGYMTMANQDDGYMYVFGIGKSSTTVSAPQNAVPQGTPVLIQGTVLDKSPAQPGTPCVADGASMSTQMQYIHMQQPIDGKFHNEAMTGVPVILTAIDSSGSVYDIGTTTSNAYYGNYGMSWTPPKADTYTILATFAGSNSYGSSTAGTQLLVTTAPVASATPTSTIVPTNYATPSDVMTYIAVGVVAIIIAIAIVGVLLLRKK
jgi:hypothetical protein